MPRHISCVAVLASHGVAQHPTADGEGMLSPRGEGVASFPAHEERQDTNFGRMPAP